MTEQHPDVLAAELALGLLEGEELARSQSLYDSDPALRNRVAAWRGTFAHLEDVPDASVPPGIWPRIERDLGVRAANDNPSQLRRTLAVWRGAAFAATVAAAALALALFVQPVSETAPASQQRSGAAPLVATLSAEGETLQLVAAWDPSAQRLYVAPDEALRAGDDQSHELWIIPADGVPRSLGTLARASQHLTIAEALAPQFAANATLAISVEPAGGSTTGQPTGPVIASGALQSL